MKYIYYILHSIYLKFVHHIDSSPLIQRLGPHRVRPPPYHDQRISPGAPPDPPRVPPCPPSPRGGGDGDAGGELGGERARAPRVTPRLVDDVEQKDLRLLRIGVVCVDERYLLCQT